MFQRVKQPLGGTSQGAWFWGCRGVREKFNLAWETGKENIKIWWFGKENVPRYS